jgi:intracellular sulfur oxidation DsrE/DsrF family protein
VDYRQWDAGEVSVLRKGAMRKTSVLAAIVLLVAGFSAASQTAATPKHRAVLQMSEPRGDEWSYLLAHVQNVRIAFANDGGVDVEVVFFGPGLNMLRKTNTDSEEILKRFAKEGVKLAACRNSMRDRNLTTDDLFPFITTVDSGVAELVRKQEAGWAYVK